MKYLLLLLLALFQLTSSSFVFSACVIEQGVIQEAGQFLSDCAAGTYGMSVGTYTVGEASQEDMKGRIIDIANGAISFGALLAVGSLVWSGIQYTKAYGEDEKIKKAKTTGVYSLIGLMLLLISFGIVDIFINFIYTVTGN